MRHHVTVTPEQVQHVAALALAVQKARQTLDAAVALVSLGHVPPDAALVAIECDASALVFEDATE